MSEKNRLILFEHDDVTIRVTVEQLPDSSFLTTIFDKEDSGEDKFKNYTKSEAFEEALKIMSHICHGYLHVMKDLAGQRDQ